MSEVKKSIKNTYITFANKEEIFSKNKIEKQLEFMKLNDAKVSIINNSNYSSLNRIVTGNFSLSSIMITKDLFEELDDKNIIKSLLEITKKNYLFEIKDKLIEHEIYFDETDIKKYCMYKELLQYCSNDNHYKKNDNLLSTIAEEYHKYANKIGRVDIYNNPVVETSWEHVKKSIIMDGFFKTIIKILKKILRRK